MDASNNSVADLSGNDVVTDLSNNVVVTDISNNNLMNRFNLLPPTPLVYPDISGINQYTNILLIENAVPDYQKVVSSVNASTLPIIYSVLSKKNDLLALLQAKFTTIPRIGFFFSSSSGRTKMFLDREPLFVDDETVPYSENLQFILNIITWFQVRNIDFLACDTLNYQNWVNYYDILTTAGVTVGASSDKTGNIKYGGDWVLESTSEDVEFVYFTQSIEYYTYLLDNPAWADIGFVCNNAVCDNNGYLYISKYDNTIVKVPISNPAGYTTWFSSGLSVPQGMCIYLGYLYVANYNDNTIVKIKLSDSTYSVFATTVQGCNSPIDLATDGLFLYVLNNADMKISKISLTYPNTVYNIGWATSTQISYSATNIIINNGYLYVNNYNGNKIIKILLSDPNTYNSSWAGSTQSLSSPSASLIYNGYMYLLNKSVNSNIITKISLVYPNTDYIVGWATSSQMPYGNLKSIVTDNKYIYVTSSAGNIAQISLPPPAPWAVLADVTATCTSMVIDNSGMYMYVNSSANNGEIGRISLTNPSTDNTVWASNAIQGFSYPKQMVLYNGYLYVINLNVSSISKISLSNPTGDFNTNWASVAYIDNNGIDPQPRGLAFYNSLLFVSCWNGYDNTGSVDIININNPADYNGNWFNGGLPTGGFSGKPEQLAISNGYLYVSCDDGTICKISIAGLSAPASTIPQPSEYSIDWVPSSQGLVSPTSMTIVGNYLYVTNQGGTTISKINLDNPTTDYNNNWATTTDGVYYPSGIATDRKSIYFGNYYSNLIFQIKLFESVGCNITGIGNIIGKGSITSIQSYSNSNPY